MKLRKTVKYTNGSVKETWDYVNGVEYKNQVLQRVAHSEGAVVRNDFGQYQHEYVLRDHLGNTRVTFTDGVNKGLPEYGWGLSSAVIPDPGYDDGVVTEADIKHINHTYPFGMAMEGNWNNAGTANNNRYLYNGKQYNDDFGIGWYDYGARFYDPSIARWSVVDPMAEARITLSGYQYVQNRPMNLVDPTGMLDAKSLYGGTYGYDSQQAAKKGISERMDDADDEAFKNAGTRKIQDFEGNSHNITEDDIQSSYNAASFSTLWANYSNDPKQIGHIDPKTKKDVYDHGCAIRLSHALSKSGITIGGYKGNKCTSHCPLGGKGKHALGATDMANWLQKMPFAGLGKVENITGKDFASKINNRTGIVYFEDYWQRETETGDVRTGDHIDLWNKGTLGTDGTMMSWIRLTCPLCGVVFGKSQLGNSKKILFFEIK